MPRENLIAVVRDWVSKHYPNHITQLDKDDERLPSNSTDLMFAISMVEEFFADAGEEYNLYEVLEAMHNFIDIDDEAIINDQLNREVYVDILVDTGDGNFDFAPNAFYPHYAARKETELENANKKASLFGLTKRQGYSEAQLWNYMHCKTDASTMGKEDFLSTVYQELANSTSNMLQLVFLRKLKLRELLTILEGKKTIRIPKNTVCGLYDSLNGGGGLFGIQLERDFEIPYENIECMLPAGGYRNSVSETYGFEGDAWYR